MRGISLLSFLFLTIIEPGCPASPHPDFLGGNGIRLIVLPLSELALRLNGLGHQVHAGTQIVFLCRRVFRILPENVAERHYVTTGNPQHGQLGQLLVVRVGGYGASQGIESRADSMHPGSLSGIRLYSSLPCHVLVISLLTALMVLPRRRRAHLMSLMNLMIRIITTG